MIGILAYFGYGVIGACILIFIRKVVLNKIIDREED